MTTQAAPVDICAQCAGQFPTCCRIVPGREASCIPISPEERLRLESHASKPGIPACVEEPNSEGFLRAVHKLFPGRREIIQKLFPSRGTHFRLSVTVDGSCIFLDKNGCVLTVEHRPYYCRLYPFWFIHSQLFTLTSPECLAVNTCSTTSGLLALFKTDTSALRTLHDSLLTAWGLFADEARRK
ncbi:YkgJ family cysteine cluster protein [Desulfonatronum thiodismutans]|uniref:YkgJ family cysteine cluster protein n=1 Tax=Desulfonatronum thiodismutans TaxID=159290 RepID=UPI0004ABE8DB|nr:YkgJ family cysteine cluster protein [Desulfonatronum thiodismutans]